LHYPKSLAHFGPKMDPQGDPKSVKKLKKRVLEFDVFFDRVPELILERLGVENGPRNGPEVVRNRAHGPKHRIFADVLNPTRLPIKSRVRAIKKSIKIDKNR
jgi:hypothetical protein